LADAAALVNAVKAAALAANDASKPVQVCFGRVVGAAPLQVCVEQKMTLGAAQLILARRVTDYTVEMTVNHYTEDAEGHRHACKGRKKYTVHNGLKAGEEVILLRMQGGQKYLILDRIGKGAAG